MVENFRYGQVAQALMQMHGINDKVAFRSQIISLRRLNLASDKPGRGARAEYPWPYVMNLAIALELMQLGAEAKVAVSLTWALEKEYPKLPGEWVLVLWPSFISDRVSHAVNYEWEWIEARDLNQSILARKRRASIINFSALQNELRAGLRSQKDG
jgi:hypothetical protein